MARRRSDTDAASMDSLMDTLTNVVGILIVMLILAQVNASRSAKKLAEALKPITIEEFNETKAALDKIQQALAEAKKLQAQPELIEAELAKKKLAIAQLEQDLAARKVPLIELATLQQKISEQQKLRDAAKAAMSALLAERDRLLALLQSTPVPVVAAPKIVRIPKSRPIPDKASFQRFIVANQRIYHVDVDLGMRLIMDDFNRSKLTLEKERTQRNGRPFTIYDQVKVVDYFAKRKPALKDVEATVMPNRPGAQLYVIFQPKPNAGKPLAEILPLNSSYQNLLRSFRSSTVVWFHVVPDSFDLYLQARDLCDQRNLSAGWEISGPAHYETLTGFEVAPLEAAPPAGPPPKILPPKRTLD